MRRATPRGGRKKLVPTRDRELKCPHNYFEEEELRLEIDCSGCSGAQDLENRRCMSGIVQILSSEALPSTVTLKRHIHKRYRERALRLALSAAKELAVLNRTSTNADAASDKRCRTCHASASRIAAALRDALLDDPTTYAEDFASVAQEIEAAPRQANCESGSDCVEKALSEARRRQGET
jgi:K+/H+ antiporter YhaU regulatory subunit KhtT